ncbi:MAG: hypothetical protein JJD98_15935 [Polaromonas sp.]|nr:hypothetical protein [Polaromonas sp.]
MNYTEETALFACAGETLLGILAAPATPAQTGVVAIAGQARNTGLAGSRLSEARRL